MAKKVAAKKAPAAKKTPAKKATPAKTAAKKPAAKKPATPAAPKPQSTTETKGTVMPEETARGSIVKLRIPYNNGTLAAVATRLGKKKLLRRELQDHLMEVVKQYLLDSGAATVAVAEPAQAALPLDAEADDLLG